MWEVPKLYINEPEFALLCLSLKSNGENTIFGKGPDVKGAAIFHLAFFLFTQLLLHCDQVIPGRRVISIVNLGAPGGIVEGMRKPSVKHTNKSILILNFYGAYILRNMSSEAQQNRIIKHNREQGRAKVIIRRRDN